MKYDLRRGWPISMTTLAMVAASALLHCVSPTRAALYTFTKIADSSGPLASFGGAGPTINNSGTVAFSASYDGNAGIGVFSGNGGPIATVADSNGIYDTRFNNAPVIDDSGNVAFTAGLDSGGSGVFLRNGGAGPVTTVYSTSENSAFFQSNYFDITPGGIVVFADQGHGIYSGNGGPITTIADAADPAYAGGLDSVPTVGPSGTVLFHADRNGVDAVFARDVHAAGPVTDVVDVNDPHGWKFFNFGRMRADGSVAFDASYTNNGSHAGIFIKDGGTGNIATVVDNSTSPFNDLSNRPALNAASQIAFWASLDSGGQGIFNGPDPVANKVIASGDSLFGGVVQEVAFDHALNESGQIAFGYFLTNGTGGIAVATPAAVPEPATPLVAAIITVALAALPRRDRSPPV